MKKVLVALLMTVSSVAMVLPEAEARRMGGGGTFGKQYSRPAPSQPAQQQGMQQNQPAQNTTAARQQQNAAAPGAAAQRPSLMRNILGGALLGLGLGALLSAFGIGGALASIIATILTFLLIGAVVVFLYRMFARKNGTHNGMQPAYVSGYEKTVTTPEIGSGMHHGTRPDAFHGGVGGAVTSMSDVPADFDTAGFLRNAKTYFIRLQAAWDRGDVSDIREFTTPEMFAELRMQLQERGDSVNHTDVLSVDADLLGIETTENDYLASVKFIGTIREDENAAPESFTEIWNLTKPVSGGGWVLAGIQQVS
jgi:predicted lipid-binding transport protein (Tim44 family)